MARSSAKGFCEGVALVAALGFDRSWIAFDTLQGQRTSLSAGDADGSHVIPSGSKASSRDSAFPASCRMRSPRLIPASNRNRGIARVAAATAKTLRANQPPARSNTPAAPPPPERGACVGGGYRAAGKHVGQSLHRANITFAQTRHDCSRRRRYRWAIDTVERSGETVVPCRVATVAVCGERRHARLDSLIHRRRDRTGEMPQRRGDDVLGLGEPRHQAQPIHHRMSGRQRLQPRRDSGESRNGIGQDRRLRRFHSASNG